MTMALKGHHPQNHAFPSPSMCCPCAVDAAFRGLSGLKGAKPQEIKALVYLQPRKTMHGIRCWHSWDIKPDPKTMLATTNIQ